MSEFPELPQLQIVTPCHESWADMSGSDQNRFCEQCDKHVFNFSAMTSAHVADVLKNQGGTGSLCARIRRRSDGSIITKDVSRRGFFGRVATAAAALVTLLSAGCADKPAHEELGGVCFHPDEVMGGVMEMGELVGQVVVEEEPGSQDVQSTENVDEHPEESAEPDESQGSTSSNETQHYRASKHVITDCDTAGQQQTHQHLFRTRI